MFRPGRTWPLLAGVVALLVLAAGACGGDDKSTTTQTPATTAIRPAASEGADDPSDDLPQIGLPAGKIVLGSHFATSGTYGAAFRPVIEGLKAYFEFVNAEKGGVCGRTIEFHVEDDGYEPARAQEVTRKLVEQDHIFAMVAGLGTAAHGAVWEYLNEKGIPDLWVMSGAHKFAADPQAHPWTVPAMPSYFVEGAIQGKYISENFPGRKVGILYQNDEFGQDNYEGLQQGLDPNKNELVVPEGYEPTAQTISSQVAYLKEAGVEVAVCAYIPGYTAMAIESADRLGWEPQWLIHFTECSRTPCEWDEVDLAGVLTLRANKLFWADDPAIQEHIRIMHEYGQVALANDAEVGQIAGELTVEVLSRACHSGILSRNSVMDTVESLRDYQSDLNLPGVTWSLSPDDHIGIEAMRPLRAKIVNGQGVWEYEGDLISFR